MKRRELLAAMLALPAAPAFAQRRDWARTVTATPAGSHLLGNPAAPHRLTEYVSFSCPYCARYHADAAAALARDHVAPGRLAVELWPMPTNALDVAASLVARARAPGGVFADSGAVFAAQARWIDRGSQYWMANLDRIAALPQDRQFVDLARGAGLVELMTARGVAVAAIERALADPAAIAALVRLRRVATDERRVAATPSFDLDGRRLPGARNWATLQPLLPR